MARPLFVTIPHSGERVPDLCPWLKNLPEPILMCDVDRFVDRLYEPALTALQIPFLKTEWHRYAGDLNRLAEDVDRDSVENHWQESGQFSRGFHWVITTKGDRLMSKPMSLKDHQQLVELIYEPFHQKIRTQYKAFKSQGAKEFFHLDLHSMPSLGTSQHRDPGQHRSQVVISDSLGKSSKSEFVDLVMAAFLRAGFDVRYNWPYVGGRLTESYGQPQLGQHVVQVELSRSLYMDEFSKKILPEKLTALQEKLKNALDLIVN